MRLVGAVNVYQDAAFLSECLAALRPQVDRLIVVDGAYRDFPIYEEKDKPKTAASTDGTLFAARAVADLVIEAPGGEPWSDEIAKRNAYLQAGEPGDYLFVVDADEILEGLIDRAALDSRDDWLIELYLVRPHIDASHGEPPPRDGNPYGIHRAFRWRPGIRYAGTHHAVHVGDALIHPDSLLRDRLPGVRLRHLSARRDPERRARKHAYYDRLAPAERAFRAAHSL